MFRTSLKKIWERERDSIEAFYFLSIKVTLLGNNQWRHSFYTWKVVYWWWFGIMSNPIFGEFLWYAPIMFEDIFVYYLSINHVNRLNLGNHVNTNNNYYGNNTILVYFWIEGNKCNNWNQVKNVILLSGCWFSETVFWKFFIEWRKLESIARFV